MASLIFISLLCATILEQYVSEKPSNSSVTYNAGADLKGQMFSVNRDSWVQLQATGVGTLTSFTVCLRQMSESETNQRFFTLNMNGQFISLVGNVAQMNLTVGGDSDLFNNFFYMYSKNTPWIALCSTWTSSTGMAQVWMDGNPSVRKGLWRNQVFSGQPVLALYGFVGQVTDVHVWSYVLTPSAIASFSKGSVIQQGTVLNWRNVQYSTSGYVVLEPMQFSAKVGKANQNEIQQGNKMRGRVMRQGTERAL
ncbi:C-reactive protein-like [Conger conger]|uniref:C-reactive protein-like n=1 Tax=Conger conger TaxID=82655 RepID=UPI002A5A9E49|nr:C-reactive protein-like [Conger conger]